MFVPSFALFTSKKSCIHCGKKPTGPFIELKQDNIIDEVCLQQIQKLFINQELDEGIREVYSYILQLIVKCMKCKGTVEKISESKQKNSYSNQLCKKCFVPPAKKFNRIKKDEKKVICVECQNEINGFNLLTCINMDEIHICRDCIDQQPDLISQQKVQKKVQMPYFGKVQNRYQLRSKKSMPNILPSYKQYPSNNKIEFQKPIKKEFQFFKQNQLKPLKQLHMKCQLCQVLLSHDKFDQAYQGLYICIVCKKNHLEESPKKQKKQQPKKKNDKASQTFGLEDLFFCQQTEKPKQNRQVQQNQKNIQRNLQPVVSRSSIYQLTECKLCFSGQSKMINIKCRHLMMCQKCFKSYQIKNEKKEELPCPVCTVSGRYQLYIEPIYI